MLSFYDKVLTRICLRSLPGGFSSSLISAEEYEIYFRTIVFSRIMFQTNKFAHGYDHKFV